MMFRNGNEDVVSLVKMGFAIGTSHQVQGFGGVSGVNNFAGAFGVNKFPYHFLGCIIGF